jgi:hypothetical protein
MTPQLTQVRQQQVEDEAVALAEAPIRSIELEARVRRLEPEADHVVGPEWARDLLVEAQSVEIPPREVIGLLNEPACDRGHVHPHLERAHGRPRS